MRAPPFELRNGSNGVNIIAPDINASGAYSSFFAAMIMTAWKIPMSKMG